MATIYRARDAQLERDVAVKLLRPEFGRDPDFLSRFRAEARAAASLSHPNIVAVHDFGQDDSGPYIVMELVEGQDLASIIRDNGPLAPRQAARVCADVAKALHAAHVRGIVHRDVKPSNVLVGRDGRVKVADFGIARALTESQLTLPGTTMGSVHYFSPEQARGEVATVASDVYSLGIVLFESLTGQRPFSGDGAAAVALARLTTTPPRPSALRSNVPSHLDAIVQRAMALDPAQRFATAAAMASALEGFLAEPGDRPAGAAGAAGAAAAGAAAAGTVASATARPNTAVPYPPDAYARSAPAPARVTTRSAPPPPPGGEGSGGYATGEPEEEPGGTGPWAWVAGLLGLAILAIVGFLVFRLMTGGGTPAASPAPDEVTLPSFVGLTSTVAQEQATELGVTIVVTGSEERTDVEPDTVLSQDPAEGATVAVGSEVRVVVSRGQTAVTVPDLRGKTEAEALQLIVSSGLTVGLRTEVSDEFMPLGAVVDQQPGPGIIVAPGTPVSYVVSTGPAPTPSPTPSPSPTPAPTPSPTPAPTPTPTPAPTPTPTPVPNATVGDYVCMTLGDARTQVEADGFNVGVVLPAAAPDGWFVATQDPDPDTSRPVGSNVNLGVTETKPASCP
jgi:serine/threonine-protein kinase